MNVGVVSYKPIESSAGYDSYKAKWKQGAWRTPWQIVVPISKPVIATIVLFVSVEYWNEYFQGLVLMNKESNYPLQTYIRQITKCEARKPTVLTVG